MDYELAQKAIYAALNNQWDQAVKTNLLILQVEPEDVDALNRIARAYYELGNIIKAKQASQKVLKIDPFNGIAIKCIKKWQKPKIRQDGNTSHPIPLAFLEEPGRTKIVKLIHLGDAKIIANLDCGDEVSLIPHSHSVSVITFEGKYIGKLPDDLAVRLINLMKNGSKYQTLIKSTQVDDVKIFIRGVLSA